MIITDKTLEGKVKDMFSKKRNVIFLIIAFMFLVTISGNASEIDQAAVEITKDVNGILFGYIQFLQWVITAVMLLITALGILPELFTAGRPPDLAGVFMKFIQAAIIIGITWAIGDFIFAIFGADINPAMIVR